MKKTRFSEEQIIAVLREQEGGMKTADGIVRPTWQAGQGAGSGS